MLDIKQIIKDSAHVKTAMLDACAPDIQKGAQVMIDAIKASGKILWCGNGGSAADAQHMAAELMGGLVSHDRPAIASIALTTDSSFVTAWANDTGYESIFSRQIEGLGESGDVLIAISTSGNSENIIRAVNKANSIGAFTIGLLGNDGGKLKDAVNLPIIIPSNDTARIQEVHITIGHIICEIIEEDL